MTERSDKDNWAKPVDELQVSEGVDESAPRGNVDGRKINTAMHGFGQMWQKTYLVHVPGATPEEVVSTWKARYGEFWPASSKFYPPASGIVPGEVAVIAGGAGPAKLSTGVLVFYADSTSFSYVTPEGHPFAGTIVFSSFVSEDDKTMAEVALLIRNNDPLYELAFKVYSSRAEDKMWEHTLRTLAQAFDAEDPQVETRAVCVDKKRQWRHFSNIYKNSALRTMLRQDRKQPRGF